jgi:hypothetical protein
MKKKQWKNGGKAKHKKDGDAEDNARPSRRRSKRNGNTVLPDADDYKLRDSIEAGTYRYMMCLRSCATIYFTHGRVEQISLLGTDR